MGRARLPQPQPPDLHVVGDVLERESEAVELGSEAREGGPSSSAAADEAEDEVGVTGTRSREEREDELRQRAVPVDSDSD